MAATLWGKVHFEERYAGILRQEPGGRCSFAYDAAYVETAGTPISHNLPVHERPYLCEGGLHPFFDNLVAEGWLRTVQARALGVSRDDRFALLLAFGSDLAGAVSVVDPEPMRSPPMDMDDRQAFAALGTRASLSGVQPKLNVVRSSGGYRPASANELGSHIAKLPSGQLPDIIALEWLTGKAMRALLPTEPVAETEVAAVDGIAGEALIVRRFDRTSAGRRLHFEEFNQLLEKRSDDKYDGSYEDMAKFIETTPGCMPVEAERLYRRVLACLLLGNTDAHMKNFAMFHTQGGLRLTPSYDLVASALYPQFDTLALAMAGGRDRRLNSVLPKHIVGLGEGCRLPEASIRMAVDDLGKHLEAAKAAVGESAVGTPDLRNGMIEIMEKRWNGSFKSTGNLLSKKRAGGARHRGLRNSG